MSQKDHWQLQDGFEIEKVVTGLSLPINIAFVPNPEKKKGSPLFYVTELYGKIKVITNDYKVSVFAEDLLNYDPDFKMPGTGESGLTGITVREKGDLFASMIYKDGEKYKKLALPNK